MSKNLSNTQNNYAEAIKENKNKKEKILTKKEIINNSNSVE